MHTKVTNNGSTNNKPSVIALINVNDIIKVFSFILIFSITFKTIFSQALNFIYFIPTTTLLIYLFLVSLNKNFFFESLPTNEPTNTYKNAANNIIAKPIKLTQLI